MGIVSYILLSSSKGCFVSFSWLNVDKGKDVYIFVVFSVHAFFVFILSYTFLFIYVFFNSYWVEPSLYINFVVYYVLWVFFLYMCFCSCLCIFWYHVCLLFYCVLSFSIVTGSYVCLWWKAKMFFWQVHQFHNSYSSVQIDHLFLLLRKV